MTHTGKNIIQETMSLCPICLKRIPAYYTEKNNEIYFEKTCKTHGDFEVLFWEGAVGFGEFYNNTTGYPPKHPIKKSDKGCPYDCGLCENHKQATCCVLFEVTKGCNLCCPICFAESDSRKEEPSIRQVEAWYDTLLMQGGRFNIQLSGGEPTIRDDLDKIIGMGREKGFSFFQLNTNGIRIGQDMNYLQALADAGLNTVFLQFDSLTAKGNIALRGVNELQLKCKAIENCKKAGIGVVLVPTLSKGINDREVGALLNFAKENMPVVRGVHFQPLSFFGRYDMEPEFDSRITLPRLLSLMESQTNGRVKASDFSFGKAEHPICSFNADYEVIEDKWCKVEKTNDCCCSCDNSFPVNTSEAARSAVANQWSGIKNQDIKDRQNEELSPMFDISALDAYIEKKEKTTLAISAMAFQDVWTVDVKRLARCHINIMSDAGDMMPFCAYNITSKEGRPLHRNRKENKIPCESIRKVTGGTLRPGGFELTNKGIEAANLKPGDTLIDIGCGSGDSVSYINVKYKMNTIGIDISEELLAFGRALHETIDIRYGRAQELPIDDNTAEAVLIECSFSHFEKQNSVLSECRRVLKPDGRLIISDIYEDEDEITEFISSAGFDILEFTDCTDQLKNLAIGLIMEYGSLEEFYQKECSRCNACSLCDYSAKKRLRYYLLVAK